MKAGRGPVPFYWILEQCHCTVSFSITFNIYNFPHLQDKQKPGPCHCSIHTHTELRLVVQTEFRLVPKLSPYGCSNLLKL